jgi:Zn-dependent peptidase ImmA (M78 family)/transcriptional regulator with XRE-family HTH domain
MASGSLRPIAVTGPLLSCPEAMMGGLTRSSHSGLNSPMPTATMVPITPSVLDWAMDQGGFTDASLADRCGVSRTTVAQWRAGVTQPTKTQFGRLVDSLKRPSMFFFLAEPPEGAAIPPSFRHPPGEDVERPLLPLEARGIRTARRIQQISTWILKRLDEPPVHLPRFSTQHPPEEAASAAKKLLNWNVDRQIRAENPSQVAQEIRDALEERGVLALHLPLREEGCRGFSIYSDYAPVIAINTHYSIPARVFSYIHELGHLLTRTDAICSVVAEQRIERWCEQFAAAFLIPEQTLRGLVVHRFGIDAKRDRQQLFYIANRLKVSLSAVAVRLAGLHLAPATLYYDALNLSADLRKARGGSGGATAPEIRVREWGRAYPRLLLEAESAGILQHHDILEYLNLSDSQLPALRMALSSAGWKEDSVM